MKERPMSNKSITIEIDERGKSSIDLSGFQGKGCADIAKTFHAKDTVEKTRTKQEFHVDERALQERRRG
jgi:hypothetical protein